MTPPCSLRAAAFLVAALASLTSVPIAGPGQDETLLRVQAILLESRDDTRSENEVVEQLAQLGAEAAPLFFALYAGGEELDRLYEVEDVKAQDVRWWGRPDKYGELAARVLAEHLPTAALEVLSTRARASLDERLAVMHVTARLGSEASCELWLEVVLGLDDFEVLTHLVRMTLRKSLTEHLGIRPENYDLLADALRKPRHPVFLEELSRAIELDGDPRGIRLLEGMLDADEAGFPAPPAQEIIPRLDALTRRYPWVLGDAWIQRLTFYLKDERRPVQLVSTAALEGRPSTFTDLLEIVEQDNDPRRVAIAQRALAQSFGMNIGMPAAKWSRRIDRELTWWEFNGQDEAYDLAEIDPSKTGSIFRELSEKTAFHGEIAALVAQQLGFMEESVALGAVAFLVDLDQPSAVPGLVQALREGSLDSSDAFVAALESLTGLQVGNDPQAWKKALAL